MEAVLCKGLKVLMIAGFLTEESTEVRCMVGCCI